jgi:radical SAM protein with 4Fe4S-binding SPASM domain
MGQLSNRLKLLSVSVTDRCNLQCAHCGAARGGLREKVRGREELTVEEHARLLREARELGCRFVIYAGGEPLERPELWQILERAEGEGMDFCLLTNGIQVDETVVRRLRAFRRLAYVRVSLDESTNEGVDRIRGTQKGYEASLSAIGRLARAGVRVGVGMTLMEQNPESVLNVALAARESGAFFIRAIPVMPIGRAATRRLALEFRARCFARVLAARHALRTTRNKGSEPYESLAEGFQVLTTECGAGVESAAVCANGALTVCPFVEAAPGAPNVRTSSVAAGIRIARESCTCEPLLPEEARSSCSECRARSQCARSCAAARELDKRGGRGQLRECPKQVWSAALELLSEQLSRRDVESTLKDLLEQSEATTRQGWRLGSCERSLPLWTIPLTTRA